MLSLSYTLHVTLYSVTLLFPFYDFVTSEDKAPEVKMRTTYSVCEGQKFDLQLRATDPEKTVVSYKLDEKTPKGSQLSNGTFKWHVTGNGEVSAAIIASDECGHSTNFKVAMNIYSCLCQNGGTCLTDTNDQPDCQYSLTCLCPPEFKGDRCEVRVCNWQRVKQNKNMCSVYCDVLVLYSTFVQWSCNAIMSDYIRRRHY